MTVLTIDQPTWSSLRLLKDALEYHNRDPIVNQLAIEKEKRLYKYMIKEIYANVE